MNNRNKPTATTAVPKRNTRGWGERFCRSRRSSPACHNRHAIVANSAPRARAGSSQRPATTPSVT